LEGIKSTVPEEETSRISIHEYWKIFWKKKYFIILPVVLAIAISYFGVKFLTPIYESKALLSIEEKSVLSQTVGKYISSVEERSRLRNRQYRAMIETKIKSKPFLELVIKEMGLDRSEKLRKMVENSSKNHYSIPLEERIMRFLVKTMREKIRVDSPMPGFFEIVVYDTDPTASYVLAKKISEKFIETTRQAQIEGIRQAGAFSDEQLAIYKEKLEAAEKELARIKKEMMETDVESNPVNATNIHYCEALRRSIEAKIEQGELRLKRIRKKLVSIFGLVPSSDNITNDETVKNSEKRLIAYSEEYLLNQLREGSDIPQTDELKKITDEIRQRIMKVVGEEYGEFSPELHSLITEYFYQKYILDSYRFQKRKLDGFIEQFRKNLARRPFLEREFNRVSHEVETNRAIYQAFLESKTSAQISEAVQSTNLGLRINIIEEPEKPLAPVKPNKIKLILLALMFAGAFGLGAIVVTEYLDDSFRSIEEVERVLKLPVLGTVPKMASGFEWERKRKGKVLLFWIIGVALFSAILAGSFYVYSKHLKSAGLGVEIKEE